MSRSMRSVAMAGLLLLGFVFLAHGQDGNPEVFSRDEVAILLMGDTQYPWECELNKACSWQPSVIKCKQRVRKKLAPKTPTDEDFLECTWIESKYSNRIQRSAMETLIKMQKYPPAGLIINGDLTAYGHDDQLTAFKEGWLLDFPIPIYPGLGNHDYENNLRQDNGRGCFSNVCARAMLEWFIGFAREKNLTLDYNLTTRWFPTTNKFTYHTGSFSYHKKVCSLTGKNCVRMVQMHNEIDYHVNFKSLYSAVVFNDMQEWRIRSGLPWLQTQLDLWKNETMPIIINFHKPYDERKDPNKMLKLFKILKEWIAEHRGFNIKRKIGVFFAHFHTDHWVRTECLHEVRVAFAQVGSVPHNTFSVYRYMGGPEGDRISLYSARESGPVFLQSFDNIWETPCP